MTKIINKYWLIAAMLVWISGCSGSRYGNTLQSGKAMTWRLSYLTNNLPKGFSLLGDPKVISSSQGKVVHFNGKDEALIYHNNPLNGLHQFTIEVVMKPDTNGPFAQRFFHLGTPFGHRVLMEIRNTGNQWYFDAYLNSLNERTLVDSTKTHPTDQWYDVAFVVDNGKMDTYVNGSHELSGNVQFRSFKFGKASLGVRLNRVYWFKGSIDKVRISPHVLKPTGFLTLK